jgi:hypothetical protein
MQNFRSYMNERGCRVIQNTSESDPYTTRKILLDNLTMNYCDYRLYLTYLGQSIAYNNLPTPYQNSPLSQAPYAVSSYISNISNLSDKISQEVEHSKMVYNQTLSAFSDFEQAYPIHVVLNFILQDYILLQTNFTRLINPIGQFIYKASNAQ